MPPIERTDLHQTAVHRPVAGSDNYGEYAIGLAVEIPVRWEDGRRTVLDPQGNPMAIDATAWTVAEVKVGSRLALGTLVQVGGTGTGFVADVMEVVSSKRTPDLKNRNVRYQLALMRSKDGWGPT